MDLKSIYARLNRPAKTLKFMGNFVLTVGAIAVVILLILWFVSLGKNRHYYEPSPIMTLLAIIMYAFIAFIAAQMFFAWSKIVGAAEKYLGEDEDKDDDNVDSEEYNDNKIEN